MKAAKKPYRVSFYMTNKCNFRCSYCFTEKYRSGDGGAPDVTVDIVRRTLGALGPFQRVMLGAPGEPTKSPHFAEVFNFLQNKTPRLNITTNGTKIRELAGQVNWNRAHVVNLTIHEVEEERFRKITGTDMFSEVIAALSYLRDRGVGLVLYYVVGRENIERMVEFVRFAASYGVKSCSILPLLNYKDFIDDEEFFWANTLNRDNEEVKRRFLEQRAKVRKITQRHGMNVSYPILVSRKTPGAGCKMAFDYIAVNGRGDIAICCRGEGPRAELGNISQGAELWNAPVLEEFRRRVLDVKDRHPKCKVCHACYELGNHGG